MGVKSMIAFSDHGAEPAGIGRIALGEVDLLPHVIAVRGTRTTPTGVVGWADQTFL